MTILVVDDNCHYLQRITKFLRGQGHHVVAHTDERQAFNWLRHNTCDVVLLDSHLPNCESVELLRAMREDFPKQKIIISSDIGDNEMLREATRKAGGDGFIPKSLGISDDFYGEFMRFASSLVP